MEAFVVQVASLLRIYLIKKARIAFQFIDEV